MERRYVAIWDDGHDRGEFKYYSDRRNNSAANRDDAKRAMIRKYGRRAKYQKIVQTWLDNED